MLKNFTLQKILKDLFLQKINKHLKFLLNNTFIHWISYFNLPYLLRLQKQELKDLE